VKALIAVVAGAALISAAPAAAGAASPSKTVHLGDNYFTPQTLTVKRGTKITWRWPGYDEAGDVHDISLMAGPKGVRKFRSEAASTDYSYTRKLAVPGKYRLGCSLHEGMRMTVKVR
jgi:plastocyanin